MNTKERLLTLENDMKYIKKLLHFMVFLMAGNIGVNIPIW